MVLTWNQEKKQGKLRVTDGRRVGWELELHCCVWSGQCLYDATCLLVAGLGCTSGVGAWGGGMGVEQEPAPARLERLWGMLGTVRGRWETGWSPWLSRGPGLRADSGTCEDPLEARCRGLPWCQLQGQAPRCARKRWSQTRLLSPQRWLGSLWFWPEQQKVLSPSSSYWSAWKARPAPHCCRLCLL